MLISGQLLLAAGLALILMLNSAVEWRATGSLIWLVYGALEVRRVERGFAHCCGIRLDAGGCVEILGQDDQWRSARLLSGSLLLRKWGWLRLRADNGRVSVELLRGDSREDSDWRRLQLIWRHVGAWL